MSQAAKTFLDKKHGIWVNGCWVNSSSGDFIDVIDPSTGDVISAISNASAEDLDSCVASARAAFENSAWRDMKPAVRASIINKFAELIEQNAEELAYLETLDGGKPISLSKSVDIPATAGAFRYYAGWADKIHGTTHNISMPGEYHTYTLLEPVGVVGLVIPWNFPLVMAAMKLGPALAAGCTCILKPAEDTSITALRLGELAKIAGFPDGVLNVITGYGQSIGAGIASHPGIDKVAFTGSTQTGKIIASAATGNLKKVTLELGGKAPNIILPDANLEKAIAGSAMGIFFNSGQVCTAASRLYVHDDVYDQVVEGIAEFSRNIKVGPGLDPEALLGPLISAKQQARVLNYIEKGREEGGEIVAGGNRIGDKGFFVSPTVIGNTTNDMTVVREEIFGPVLVAQRFSEIDEVVTMANDSDYGLSAVIWTNMLGEAHKLARRIRAGNISINAGSSADWDLPIGGFKQSGWGRENGLEGLMNYLDTKAVVTSLD
ncbi:aldehyde dehydrogenase family protein [Aliiglaciecola sp. SL4]|uniref:aldehyde dehydrogenase family protein n=1 Tax=Aliiglaciecola sp. SL4 TaxID=3239806 RepID=UPI00355BB164